MACSRLLPVQRNLFQPLLLKGCKKRPFFDPCSEPLSNTPPRKPDPTPTQIHLTSWYPPPSFPRKLWCPKQVGQKCNGILTRLNHRSSVWRRSGYSTEHSLLLVLWMVGNVNGCYKAIKPRKPDGHLNWMEIWTGMLYQYWFILIERWVTERGRATRWSRLLYTPRWPTGPTHHSCFAIRALAEPDAGAISSAARIGREGSFHMQSAQTQSHNGLT